MTPDETLAFLTERTDLIGDHLAAFNADFAGRITDKPHPLNTWQSIGPLMSRASFARGWQPFDGHALRYCPQMIATATAVLDTCGPVSAELYVELIEACWSLSIDRVINGGTDPETAHRMAIDVLGSTAGVAEFMFMVEASAMDDVFDEPPRDDGSWASDLGLAP